MEVAIKNTKGGIKGDTYKGDFVSHQYAYFKKVSEKAQFVVSTSCVSQTSANHI